MILMVTSPTDTHADRMEALLERRGVSWARFDPAQIPAGASMAVRFSAGGHESTLVDGIDLRAVSGVWLRRPGSPTAHKSVSEQALREFVDSETQRVVLDLLDTMDARVLPAPRPVVWRAQYKVRQLRLAGLLGFELPPTLVTNDPEELLEFATRHPQLISKQAASATVGEALHRFTEPVRPVDLLNADAVRLCPVMIQAAVPKRVELRITVVGESVHAAAIHSQDTHHTRDDWRHYDNAHTTLTPYDLPDAEADRCVRLTRALGLCYGAIDMIVTPDGRPVFLEINPSGQYLWIEEATGLPITAAIADHLMEAVS